MKTADKLVMMANQIAANLAHEPDPADATAEHIRLFWDPWMKAGLRDAGLDALTPVARAAFEKILA
jgi:formate dehydrogenase subunit delta